MADESETAFAAQADVDLDRSRNGSMSVDDVRKVIDFAKLDVSNIRSLVQRINFVDKLLDNQIKLLELDPAAAKELERGGKLLFKGSATENCVLCTSNETFEVKGAEISNSLLLLPNLVLPNSLDVSCSDITLENQSVAAVMHEYLELRPIRPKLKPLRDLLQATAYDGPESEEKFHALLTKHDIMSRIQASRSEIEEYLVKLEVLELDGFLRLIDFDYLTRVLGSVIALVEENSWSYKRFNKQECCDILDTIYPRTILEHTLNCYGLPSDSDVQSGWSLNEDKVCRFFAEVLLRPTQKFNLGEFLEAWRQSVPEGMTISMKQIDGLAVTDMSRSPAVMCYFNEADLSEDVKERFDQLFEAKKQWTMEEITPYIVPLCVGKQTAGVLLTKYSRSFLKSGNKLYTSKYAQ